MTASCSLCVGYSGLKAFFDRYSCASRTIQINAGLLLLFFCPLAKNCQPFDEVPKDWQTHQKTFRILLRVRSLFMEGIIHSCLLCLWIDMALTCRCLGGAHYR